MTLAASALVVSASACGGNNGNAPAAGSQPTGQNSPPRVAHCQYIAGGSSHVLSVGPVSNAAAAADGDLLSFATLNLTGSDTTVSIRATAQNGVIFPAGSRAGVYATERNPGLGHNTSLRTYLGGVLQEEGDQSEYISPSGDATAADEIFWFATTKTFDAVEAAISDPAPSSSTIHRVYEICADAYVR